MCTIVGIELDESSSILFTDIWKRRLLEIVLSDLLFIRGRDGIGIAILNDSNTKFKTKYLSKDIIINMPNIKIVSSIVNYIANNSWVRRILVHSRAVPETESNKGLQPIRYKDIVLIHNGLIYNDKEIYKTYDKRFLNKQYIDSYSIAVLLNNKYNNGLSINDTVFDNLKGSYAVLYTVRNDNRIRYLVNYNPLFIYKFFDNFTVYTNIEPEYYDFEFVKFLQEYEYCIKEIEPYSFS